MRCPPVAASPVVAFTSDPGSLGPSGGIIQISVTNSPGMAVSSVPLRLAIGSDDNNPIKFTLQIGEERCRRRCCWTLIYGSCRRAPPVMTRPTAFTGCGCGRVCVTSRIRPWRGLPPGNTCTMPCRPRSCEGNIACSDFPSVGSRELVAADYVYQVKRLASPETPSPVYGLMSEHIVGLKACVRD